MSVDTHTETVPATFLGDKLLAKKPIERIVTIFLDGSITDELQKAAEAHAVMELQVARERIQVITEWSAKGMVGDLQALLDAFDADAAKRLEPTALAVRHGEDAARDSSVDVHFRSIGRQAYAELEREHPATDEDHAQMPDGQKAQYHFETWAPAIVAASSELSLDEVNKIFAMWNQPEINELYLAALWVNNTRRVAELGKAHG